MQFASQSYSWSSSHWHQVVPNIVTCHAIIKKLYVFKIFWSLVVIFVLFIVKKSHLFTYWCIHNCTVNRIIKYFWIFDRTTILLWIFTSFFLNKFNFLKIRTSVNTMWKWRQWEYRRRRRFTPSYIHRRTHRNLSKLYQKRYVLFN